MNAAVKAHNSASGVIDRKTSPDAAAPTPQFEQPGALWGQRMKDHRKSLLDLCKMTLARSSCPAAVKHVAQSLQSILTPAKGIFFTFRGDVGGAFKSLAIPDDMVTANDLLDEVSDLYKSAISTASSARMAEIREIIENNSKSAPARKKPFNLPESLDDLQLENRQVHTVANSLSSVAGFLAISPESKDRDAAVAMKFLSSALENLAPYRIKMPINTCVLCHRHDSDRQICRQHVDAEEHRYTSSTVQRGRVQDSLTISERNLSVKVSAHRALLLSLIQKEQSEQLMMSDIQKGFDALFPTSEIADVERIWSEVVADYARRCKETGMQPEPVKVNALAWCWYAHPSIDDPKGFERMEQPLSSMLLKLFNDIMRYESFIDAGGEVIRKRRKSISEVDDMRKIGIMRQTNKASMREIAVAMEISTSQVKRILLEMGID